MTFIDKLQQKNLNYASASPLVAVFLGDSVTHGAFETAVNHRDQLDGTFDQEAAYHARLRSLLQAVFPNVPLSVVNAGINGGGASQGLALLDRDVLAYHPDLVVVCFGLNDVHGGEAGLPLYADNLRRIFHSIKAGPADLIFMTPNGMNTYVSARLREPILRDIAARTADLQNSGMMDRYMEQARTVCAAEQVPVCDCYRKWRRLAELGADTTALLANGINHPNRNLHQLFASALFELILFGT